MQKLQRGSKGKGTPYPWPMDQIRVWIEHEDRGWRWVAEKLGVSKGGLTKAARKAGIRAKRTGPKGGARHPNWKGGRTKERLGYIEMYCPGHPYAKSRYGPNVYVCEHRVVMECLLGRYLMPNEIVHHMNEKRNDNRPENLMLFQSNQEHLAFHRNGLKPGWQATDTSLILRAKKKLRAIRRASARGDEETIQTLLQSPT